VSHLLSLDPGIRSPGVALWDVSGATFTPSSTQVQSRLLAAGKVRLKTEPGGKLDGIPLWTSDAERWMYVASEVIIWMLAQAQDLDFERSLRVETFVFERPAIRREAKSKGNHNDLIPLAAVGTAVAVMLGNSGVRPRVLSPIPEEWTGQLPKSTAAGEAWRSPRGRRIADRLRPEELALVPTQHDCVDAVGIGLWALGRFSARHAFQR
jgi:hypothetical protein